VRIWPVIIALCAGAGCTPVPGPSGMQVVGMVPGGMGEKAANDQVRLAMAQYGDRGVAPRDVRHYTYPQPGNPRAAPVAVVIRLLKKQGFAVETLAPVGLQFSQTREIASPDFDALTQGLQRSLTNVGWIYDGWESALVQGDNS
jgi:hypothetical protein